MSNIENLDPCRDTETAKARGKQGGIASGKAKREKKRVSEVLKEEFDKKYHAKTNSLSECINKIFDRSDGTTVALLKTILEAAEGKKIEVNTNIDKELGEFVSSLREHASDKKTS